MQTDSQHKYKQLNLFCLSEKTINAIQGRGAVLQNLPLE